MGRGTFRLLVVTVLIVLVVVNLLVLLYLGPSITTNEADEVHPKDWEEDPTDPEEPEVYEDVEGPEPGEESKN